MTPKAEPFRLPAPGSPGAPMSTMPPPSPGEQMGLSALFAPGAPAGFRWGGEITAPDGQQHHILIFETVVGSFGVTLDPNALRTLADQARGKASGLTL